MRGENSEFSGKIPKINKFTKKLKSDSEETDLV